MGLAAKGLRRILLDGWPVADFEPILTHALATVEPAVRCHSLSMFPPPPVGRVVNLHVSAHNEAQNVGQFLSGLVIPERLGLRARASPFVASRGRRWPSEPGSPRLDPQICPRTRKTCSDIA